MFRYVLFFVCLLCSCKFTLQYNGGNKDVYRHNLYLLSHIDITHPAELYEQHARRCIGSRASVNIYDPPKRIYPQSI